MTEQRATLARYIIVGGTAYVVEMASLYSFRHFAGFSPLISVAISFWIGFVVAFIAQKTLTFRNYDRRKSIISKQLVSYGLLVAWNYLFTLAAVRLLAPPASVFLVRTGVIVIVTIWNFYIYRKIIFKTSDNLPVE